MNNKMDIIDSFSSVSFFEKYWEKNPVIINNFIEDSLLNIINIDEIAGLALENDLVSRLVTYVNKEVPEINIDYGPFSEKKIMSLDELLPWTLLIQDTEKYLPTMAEFLNKFDFLPLDFLDDIMASISGNGGSTGPHLDWYSVFIIQIEGEKNWKIERSKRSFTNHNQSIHNDLELKILKNLQDFNEINLTPGQILYIPPGHGHWGTANGKSFSLSVGYQGPRLIHLIEEYIQTIVKNIHEDQRVSFDAKAYSKNKCFQLIMDQWPNELSPIGQQSLISLIQKSKERDL